MVHRCCISSCGMNVRVAEAKGLSYHGFPNKESLREQWIQAILPHIDKPESFKVVPKYTRVCSRHFRKKDYSVDIKKRARLNSNAVPSVFPRKNSPIVIPNVLGSPNKGKVCKPDSAPVICTTENVISASTTTLVLSTSRSSDDVLSSSMPQTSTLPGTVTWTSGGAESEDGLLESTSTSLPREFFIESTSFVDDQLTLTIRDTDGFSSSSISQEDLSQSSNFSLNEDSNEAPHKKRKRRKWNRTAFDRPAKGKKKIDEVSIEGVGEALAEISLSTLLTIATPELRHNSTEIQATNGGTKSNPIPVPASASTEGPTSLQTLSLPLHNSITNNTPPEQLQYLSSVEQELLRSIQAVSLHCGGEPDNNEISNLGSTTSDLSIGRSIHHSSEESVFSSTEDEGTSLTTTPVGNNSTYRVNLSTANPVEPSLLTQIVEIDLNERDPTLLDIENLATHFQVSLLTEIGVETPISLSLDVNDLRSGDTEDAGQHSVPVAPEEPDVSHIYLVKDLEIPELSIPDNSVPQKGRSRKKKQSENPRLVGVTKKYKKEKALGQFSVERFSNSDKDIEYYTGFSTYRHFEAFFRSLEAYVERLKVTDVMFGVANLDLMHSSSSNSTDVPSDSNESCDGSEREFVVPLPPPPSFDDSQKKRPFHGRSMSRLDELFMTVIRLRRKLPEKVLGHMFCISQPTVSRIIRAWTVLLSKLIDCYPVESDGKVKTSKAGAPKAVSSEHSYTSRGLGIPDAFRQLFHSELAQSIVVTSSVSAKDRKCNQKSAASSSSSSPTSSTTSLAKRSKKSKVEEIVSTQASGIEETTTSVQETDKEDAEVCSNLLDSDSVSNLIFNACDVLEGSDFFQTDFLN